MSRRSSSTVTSREPSVAKPSLLAQTAPRTVTDVDRDKSMDSNLPLMKRLYEFLVYDGYDFNTVQLHMWSIIIGILGGAIVTLYKEMLGGWLWIWWQWIPTSLEAAGVFGPSFPLPHYTWIASTLLGLLSGIAIISMHSPGDLPDLVHSLHNEGYTSLKHFIPMVVISILTISTGGSAGPEAPVLILIGCLGSWFAQRFNQSQLTSRVLTLCGMSAGLSAFFGLPLGGGLFVMEVPHRMGLQYFEALSPAIVSSILSVFVRKVILNEPHLGGKYDFPRITDHEHAYLIFLHAVVLGVIAGMLALIFIIGFRSLNSLQQRLGLKKSKRGRVAAATLAGLLIGVIGYFYPHNLFWSEDQMQTVLDRGTTPLPIMNLNITAARVTSTPLSAVDYLTLSFLKIAAIWISLLGSYPGGIIFPLFFVGCTFAWFFTLMAPLSFTHTATAAMCLMAGVEAAVTRTPWATAIVVFVVHKSFKDTVDYTVSLFPTVLITIYVALFLTRKYPMFWSQRSRRDILYRPYSPDSAAEQQEALLNQTRHDTLNAYLMRNHYVKIPRSASSLPLTTPASEAADAGAAAPVSPLSHERSMSAAV